MNGEQAEHDAGHPNKRILNHADLSHSRMTPNANRGDDWTQTERNRDRGHNIEQHKVFIPGRGGRHGVVAAKHNNRNAKGNQQHHP